MPSNDGRDGAGATRPAPDPLDLVVTEAEPGRLNAYQARIGAALDRLVSLWGVEPVARGPKNGA
jgi:hypothetical protein